MAEDGTQLTFDKFPFLTISKTHRVNQRIEFKSGQPVQFSQTTEEIETPVSEFNFDNLIAEIIDSGEYADQNLLKEAVSYRFIDSVGRGNPEYEDEGLKLQAEIVKNIVKTYNRLRKELGMPYSEKEIETGLIVL